MKHRYLECIHDSLQIKPQISYGLISIEMQLVRPFLI